MSKPIWLTEELLTQISNEFIANIRKAKMFDGKINYTKNFKWDADEKAIVIFSPIAFAKMTALVQSFDSEVAWHGVATRDAKEKNRFYITDIIVYPQVVTGSTVNTDQDEYTNWLYSQDDEVFNNIRMQGHSHVNFATTPSAVDTAHQEKILAQLDKDMFYIFMIWNKKFERTVKIFDLANNTLYENGDVTVTIGAEGVDLDEFLKGAKASVKTKTYQADVYTGGNGSVYGGYYGGQSPYQTPPKSPATYQKPAETKPKNAATPKSKPKGGTKSSIGSQYKNYAMTGYGVEDDDDDPYGEYQDRFYR